MFAVYPACFHKEENGYSVIFPDLPGAVTCGSSFEEASRMAADCLAGYIFTNEQLGIDTPEASGVKDADRTYAAELWEVPAAEIEVYPVSVDVTAYAAKYFRSTVHKNVSIESWVDEEAKALGINFSKTLQTALIEKIRAAKT